MTRYLWLGNIESDAEFEIKCSKGYFLASSQVSQKNILYGIEKIGNISFDTINGSVLPPYPKYRDLFVKENQWSHNSVSRDVSVGFVNFGYLNRFSCMLSMIKEAKKWVKLSNNESEINIVVYSMRTPNLRTAIEIKKVAKNVKIYLIVTDLPQFMDLNQSNIKKMLKSLDWINIRRQLKEVEGFILYTTKMADFLNIPKDKWLLMEGLYNVSEKTTEKEMIEKKNIIMYSGKLDKKYGLEILLNAFSQIYCCEVELWLTGEGDYVEEIMKKARIDHRIKYHGFLPSRSEVLKLQSNATILVNMRLPSERSSAYCFPSKLLEFMATGIPVITFRLEGVPQEYYEYVICVEEETPQALAIEIERALMMNEQDRDILGKKASNFIINEKSIETQSKRILSFVRGTRI